MGKGIPQDDGSSSADAQATSAVVVESSTKEKIFVSFPYMQDSSEGVSVLKANEAALLHVQSNATGHAGATSLEEIRQLIGRFLPADE